MIVAKPNASEPTVLIVGGGPTGLTLALMLARAGIRSVVVERDAGPQKHPAACILNTRTMEIFRRLGVSATIESSCQDVFERANITWAVSLAGRELAQCSALPENLDQTSSLSPTHTTVFSQHRLETLLWRQARQNPLVDFLPYHECNGVTEIKDGVTVEVVDRKTSSISRLRASYLVGCDGASSWVRTRVGVEMQGRVLQHMLGVHFTADLGAYVNHRKSILYWILNPKLMGVLIAHWLPSEWVLFAPYFPPQQKFEDFTEEMCRELIATAVGSQEIPDLKIANLGSWVLAADLADRYRVGRIFLAGDAAHRFPPTGGLGLNTGVQDADNLAWKLSAVLRDEAEPGLLATYEPERRPVAKTNSDHSVHNFEKMNELNRVAGLDFKYLRILEAVQHSWAFRAFPSRVQNTILNFALRVGLGRLAKLDADGGRGDAARAEFRGLIPGQSAHYQFLGLDLGFDYRQGAVVPEQSDKPQAPDPIQDYRPTTWPGSRLPHAWVARGNERLSTLDLLEPNRYLLLTDELGSRSWREASESSSRRFKMPVECVSIGKTDMADLVEENATWSRLSELEPGGALLVRPDGHVGWRCKSLPTDPSAELEDVLSRLYVSPTGSRARPLQRKPN